MNTVIKQLSSGYEVEVRPVPPTAYLDVEMEFTRNHPPPQKPRVNVVSAKSVAGHVEQVEELASVMDSPEYQDYQHQLELRDMELRAAKINFAYNYAVVRWHKQDEAWIEETPDDWVPDDLIPDKTSPKRTIFIKYELIQSLEDDRAVSNPHQVAPLTEEEVAAALKGFHPDQEQRTSGSGTYKRKAHRR